METIGLPSAMACQGLLTEYSLLSLSHYSYCIDHATVALPMAFEAFSKGSLAKHWVMEGWRWKATLISQPTQKPSLAVY